MMLSELLPARVSASIHVEHEPVLVAQEALGQPLFYQSVVLRALLCQCIGLQAKAESQLGRTTDAEASQRKALSYVDPAADQFLQDLLLVWRKLRGELCFFRSVAAKAAVCIKYRPAPAVCRQAVGHVIVCGR